MGKEYIWEYFEEVEVEEEYAGYDGYYYSIGEAITLVIVGSLCGLRNPRQIWQWATNDKIKEFLSRQNLDDSGGWLFLRIFLCLSIHTPLPYLDYLFG